MAWKLAHVTCYSSMHPLFQFSEFWGHFWAIYEFSWFCSIYFWFLVVTRSYESLEGIHASFEIFEFLYEQWSQFEVGMMKINKIQTCQNFGSVDGPRVRGGRSAIHKTCSPEALQKGCQSQQWNVDCPPKVRGRSASVPVGHPQTVRPGTVDSPHLVSCSTVYGASECADRRSSNRQRTVRPCAEL